MLTGRSYRARDIVQAIPPHEQACQVTEHTHTPKLTAHILLAATGLYHNPQWEAHTKESANTIFALYAT